MQVVRRLAAIIVSVSLALSCSATLAHGPSERALLARTEVEPRSEAAATLTGTVNEIIIDDLTRGTSHRYLDLIADDGSIVPLQGRAAEGLAKNARVEVSGRRQGQALEVEGVRTVASGGASAGAEKSVIELDGTLAMLHADDFAGGKSMFVYEVHLAQGGVRRLRMGSLPVPLEPGMRVRVAGRVERDGESVTPERLTILALPTSTIATDGAVAKAATANSVLVIMANFSNTVAPAYTAAQAQQVMTTNDDSVANFFRETSYGQQLMNVTVTPSWVRMNLAQPASCGSSDWGNIGSSADAAAKALGAAYDPAAYQFVVYLFPRVSACGWLGLAYISRPHKAWINGVNAFGTGTIAHEMGHNFGLLHAASLRCNGAVIGGTCSSTEYGDPFDTMGNQRTMHYNAMQKAKLGWIPASSVKTHTGGSATYTLSPLETTGGATYAIKIPTTSTNRTYWLEFRQPIGFDAELASYPNNGAQVRVSSPFETMCGGCDNYSDDTQMLDMTPATSSFTDATLVVGKTFTDSSYGLNVTVTSATASALTIQVSSGGATPPSPAPTTTTITGTPNPSMAAAMVTFTATVAGSSPTGSVTFTDGGNPIPGCGAVNVSGSGNVRTGACATITLAAGSHSVAAAYSGDGGNAASASAPMTQTVTAVTGGTNVALASNGAVAIASSTHDASYAASYAIDNKRSGSNWGAGGGWNDGTSWAFPDWLQINFNGSKTIDRVVVYTVQDNFLNPVEPTDSMTFTQYGLTAFQVQGWNGSGWVTLASVTGNNLVKRTVTFNPYTTDRIRIYVTGAKDGVWSRITEVEAWTSASSPMTNYALSANGAVATASSTHDASYAASYAIDNKRSGANWGAGGGWNDGTPWAFPDWLQVKFNGPKTIERVVVYTVQDNFLNPVEPTDSMVFTLYGITDFQVQGWNGSSWVTLASVSGNNLVKRSVSFSPYTTDRIRIYVTGAKDGFWSRITEVEAWGS